MKRLHQSLLALLVGFTLFVNVVVATQGVGAPDGLPVIYLSIAMGLVAVTLLLRPRRRTLVLTIAAALLGYGAVRVGTTVSTGPSTLRIAAMTVMELALLVVLILASHRVAKSLREVTHLIAHLAAGGGDAAAAADPASDPRVRREMTRSRRYHRPLSVVLLEPSNGSLRDVWPQLLEEARDAFTRRYVTSTVFGHIARRLRFVDVMFEDVERGRFVLLCPEARSEEVEKQVERIRRTTLDATGVRLNAGWASFPETAVTFEELVRAADSHLRSGSGVDAPVSGVGASVAAARASAPAEPG